NASYLCTASRPDSSVLPGFAVTCSGGVVSLDLSGQPAGTYTVVVVAVDDGVHSSDLASADVLTLTYTLRVPNPTLATGSNPANQTGAADDVAGTGRSPSWSVTDADGGATLTCAATQPGGTVLPGTKVTCTGGTVSLKLAGQPAGTYTVKVGAVDSGVNSPGFLTLTYTLTVPSPTLATGSNPANLTGVADDVAHTGRAPSWTVTDADADATYTCSVSRPDGSALPTGKVTCSSAGAVALNLSGEPAGLYTVTVLATDAGVNSAGALSLTYLLLPPAPTLAVGSNPANQTGVADDLAGTGRSPSWTVTDADAGATFGCVVTRPDGTSLGTSAVTCTAAGVVSLDLSAQPAGTYTVKVRGVDAGVNSASVLTLTYTLTVPNPTLASGSSPADQTGVADDVAGSGRSPSWTVTDADAGATFTCAVTRPDGSVLLGLKVTCSGGTVSLNLAGQPAGTYTVKVRALDSGITSPGFLTLTYTLTVPDPTLVTGSNPANQTGVADDVAHTGRSPSWTVTAADAG
ncbi:MAG TPA: hypothetical protein VKJ07_15295, partial [Mycobacteriales bacterium]|nr:hypothetical protein [Mycobacteriales bacterium]